MATKNPKTAGPATKGLQVTSKPESFCRGGQQFNHSTRVVPLADLTPEQADAIREEPMLVVAEVDIEPVKT